MQTPTSSYPGGAVPSSKNAVHSVPLIEQVGSARSQTSPQHDEPLQFGNDSGARQMVPQMQSLMNPHGSRTGMSWVALAHTKLPPSKKHEVPSPEQSCKSGLHEVRHRLIEPLLAIEHELQ